MTALTAFVAYPSYPKDIGDTVKNAATELERYHAGLRLKPWEQLDIPGRFIADAVLEGIDAADFLIADITTLNFNVTYEIGFAIGRGKRAILVAHTPFFHSAKERIQELGIFDTLGYKHYENSKELAALLRETVSVLPLALTASLNRKTPLYITETRWKTDLATRVLSRVKKSRIPFRSFNPAEQSRLSGFEAISQVSQSIGVLVQLVPRAIQDAEISNLRGAFIAGLAHGMSKVLVILQQGADPVGLDCRDLVSSYNDPGQLDDLISDFAGGVYEAKESRTETADVSAKSQLAAFDLGASSAENELRDLQQYYLPTEGFRRALRGEVRLVVGRKGSGKTAVFLQVRDKVRSSRQNVVLDLKPDGFRLLKFRDRVLKLLEMGSAEHTITAFWECLLYLELTHKVLDNDRERHRVEHAHLKPYRDLGTIYREYAYEAPGDFAERMSNLLTRIENDFAMKGVGAGERMLASAEVTELIHQTDIRKLESALTSYLSLKKEVWILFDNIDKGWSSLGITRDDLVIVKGLVEATRKIERALQKEDVISRTLLFIRNDVYELLIESMPDRGKEPKAFLDWNDSDMLRELILKRVKFFGDTSGRNRDFSEAWASVCVGHVDGEESSQYLIDRCLMRPRYLIDLVLQCRGVAMTLGHSRMEQEDLKKGVATFSSDIVADLSNELRDILPAAATALHAFYSSPSEISEDEAKIALMESKVADEDLDRVLSLLLWYGFLGVCDASNEPRYIYQVNYDSKLLESLRRRRDPTVKGYQINPAFRPALGING
jgi:hypothetical protein